MNKQMLSVEECHRILNDICEQSDDKEVLVNVQKTLLLFDEIDVLSEKAKKIKLSDSEENEYSDLKAIFSDKAPTEDIKTAIEKENGLKELRKKYLLSQKIKNNDKNKPGSKADLYIDLMFAIVAIPSITLGIILSKQFLIPGIIMIIISLLLPIPLVSYFVRRSIKNKKRKKKAALNMKKIAQSLNDSTNFLNNIYEKYSIQNSDRNKLNKLNILLRQAKRYEELETKENNYLRKINSPEIESKKQAIIKNTEIIKKQFKTISDEYVEI